jgi:hypothetical protein
VEPAALRLPPELRTPPSPAAHVRGGDRPSSTDLEQRSRHQPNLRSCVFTQCVRPRVARRDARRASSTMPRPAFVSARVSGASAVVVTPLLGTGSRNPVVGSWSRGRYAPWKRRGPTLDMPTSRECRAEWTLPADLRLKLWMVTVARSGKSRMALGYRKDGTGGHIPCIS